MSYRSTILSDYPLAYYPLDDMTTTDSVLDFTDLLNQFNTYQDVLDNFSSYANMYGDIAYDHSGLNNNGNYIGDPVSNILPIVVGNSRASKVTSTNHITYTINHDYFGREYEDHFGTKYSSDADFTLECWIYPKFTTSTITPILADITNNVGLFYDNGNITFKLNSQSITYTLVDIDRVFHVVAVYAVNFAYLYINGYLVASLSLSEFEFTNSTCNLQSGPTNSTDYFHINSMAAYRYGLSADRILDHYNNAMGLPPIQIVTPSNGEIFQIYDKSPSLMFNYSYPGNKSWDYLIDTGLYFDSNENSLSIAYDSAGSPKNIVIEDYISLPILSNIDSSKIEWTGTSGVTVETSIDGITYTECENGSYIPGYQIGNFSSNAQIYLRITLDTSDASKYLPKIYDLIINLYADQLLYANNSASRIYTLEGVSGVTAYDIGFGNKYSEILWRNSRNGIKTISNSGFHLFTDNQIRTLEFFYTPSSLGDDSGLVEAEDGNGFLVSVYRWNNAGQITKTGISSIYVNGVNKTSETHIQNVFTENELHHVLIVYSDIVSGPLKFSHTTYGSVPALYQNIALYPAAFTTQEIQNAYSLYINKSYEIVSASPTVSMQMSENSANYYNNDWIVVQTS